MDPDQPELGLWLRVHTPAGTQGFRVAADSSVRDVLDTTQLRVRAACGGTGTCGACVVRLIGGAVSDPTLGEYLKLSAEQRERGYRLACQLRLRGDAEVWIDDPAPPSRWKSIPPEDLAPASGRLPDLRRHIYGVAVDLGTSFVRVSLWDRKQGRRIASRRGPNPQAPFGADVLNRLDAARQGPERAEELARLARSAIVQAVRDMLKRDVGEVGPMLAEIGELFLVGNSAMLVLLSGQGAAALLDPENWSRPVACQPADPEAWHAQWFMPNLRVRMPGPVAGFIGPDLLADLLAVRFTEGPPGSLLLDVGTNTEIALWDGRTLHVTSVPGGPAFEGVGIRNGMAAEPGTIRRVRRGAAGLVCDTIAGAPIQGFCGSGLLDAVAALLASGQLKPSGRFARSPGPDGIQLAPGNPRSAISGLDVDALQRAKAATAAAMVTLLRQAGLGWRDIRRLCVCGAFGRTLEIANAQALGLLPGIDRALIELDADASLAGCELALLSGSGTEPFERLTQRINAINLSLISDYDITYMDHLRLQPISLLTP